MKHILKENNGFVLAVTMLLFGLISILGFGIIGVSVSNLKSTMVSSISQSAYYIAEAGANKAVDQIGSKVEELSNKVLSHDEFFKQLDEYINKHLELVINDFEENYNTIPMAEIKVYGKKVSEDVNIGSYSKRTVNYHIDSIGQIGQTKRTITTTIKISHGIENEKSDLHPGFNYVLYNGGDNTISNPGGAIIHGSIYGYDLKFAATGTQINGSLVSEKAVEIKDKAEIDGNIYAMDGGVKLLSTNIKMNGDIHATDDVKLESAETYNGNIYSLNGGVELLNSNIKMNGDIHAGNNVILSSGSTLNGDIFTKGGVILKSANTSVAGDIHSIGNVEFGSGSKGKNIYTDGDLTFVSNNAVISGEIHNGGNIDFGSGTKVGQIYTEGNIKFASNNTIEGDINAGGYIGDTKTGNNIKIIGNIISDGDVITRSNQSYIINGHVHSKGKIINGTGNYINGDAVSKESIENHGEIRGNIIENSDNGNIFTRITPQRPKSPQGPDLENIKIDNRKIPLNTYEIGNEDIKSNKNSQTYDIEPGEYNNIELKWNDTIELSSGNYYINNISANYSAIKLKLDISDGPINIYSKGNITFGSGLELYVSENGKDFIKIDESFIKNNLKKLIDMAGQIYWETYGDFTLSSSTYFIGSILANNNITTGYAPRIIGSYAVNNGYISLGYNPYIIYSPPTTSAGGSNDSANEENGEGKNIIPKKSRIIIKDPIREKQ